MKYFPVIGLEVHVELATKSGMFCGCAADAFGKEPNTNICPVCLGLPGALPVPNKKAIEWTIMLGLALGSKINQISYFERKNYFYPDLPKGYQISQNEAPFCVGGNLGKIRINNIHLEEDTGKLMHVDGETLVDFNRSGVPLVEIVTEPDFKTLDEVDNYLKSLQRIIRYLGISNADMEKGTMRLEPSISLTTDYNLPLPKYRVELKNINSFRFARKALEYEIERQTKILENGETPIQETRGWNEIKNATISQRSKEEAHDYRYFPEPDIPPIHITDQHLAEIKSWVPELPEAKSSRFITQYGLTEYQANILVDDRQIADGFEDQVKTINDFSAKDIANSIINKRPLTSKPSGQYDEVKLIERVKKVLEENPKVVADYQAGKTQVLGFLIGQIKREFKEVDPTVIGSKLQQLLK